MGKAQKQLVGAALVAASGLAATFASGARDDNPQRPEMVYIPGGEFWMGNSSPHMRDAQPVHRVEVHGFWMDTTEVTNDQFATFVRATGYLTLAERPPRMEDAPGIPVDKLVAGSIVFTPPREPVALDNQARWWRFVAGANWQHPEGPQSDLSGRMQHPVVHIAHADALAYAKWAKKRLPTEAEWERAARGGLDRKTFAWGNSARVDGKHMANTFQGHFPDRDAGEDGYARAAPVASFAPNPFGLYDMAGNVWEWVSDNYRPDYYRELAQRASLTRNPQGPSESFDPDEPGVKKRVQKGGSFLCTEQYCARYMPGARGKGIEGAGTDHAGFRCAR